MAHSLSAQKRVRQNRKRNVINRGRKSRAKTQIKQLDAAIESANKAAAAEQYKTVSRQLDKLASAGTIHKKTAARKKSRLAKRLNALKTTK